METKAPVEWRRTSDRAESRHIVITRPTQYLLYHHIFINQSNCTHCSITWCKSLLAPLVTLSLPNTISSAALPPMQTSNSAFGTVEKGHWAIVVCQIGGTIPHITIHLNTVSGVDTNNYLKILCRCARRRRPLEVAWPYQETWVQWGRNKCFDHHGIWVRYRNVHHIPFHDTKNSYPLLSFPPYHYSIYVA